MGAASSQDRGAVAAALGEEVTVDYSSLFRGEVETLTADELLAPWQGLLPGFDATMHLLGRWSATTPVTRWSAA